MFVMFKRKEEDTRALARRGTLFSNVLQRSSGYRLAKQLFKGNFREAKKEACTAIRYCLKMELSTSSQLLLTY